MNSIGPAPANDPAQTPTAPEPVTAAEPTGPQESREGDVGSRALPGERSIPSVNRARTVESRAIQSIVLVLVAAVTVAGLYWYYSNIYAQQRKGEESERRSRESKASGDVRPPRLIHPEVQPVRTAANRTAQPTPPLPPAAPAPAPVGAPLAPAQPAGPPPKSPAEIERDRLLAGSVTLRTSNHIVPAAALATSVQARPLPVGIPSASMPPQGLSHLPSPDTALAAAPAPMGGAPSNPGPLALSLRPTATPAVRAQMLPERRFLLPKGSFIDCTLETALDSTLAGLVTCISATDIFSADGQVVLIERGTRFVGETRADVRQGQARIGVLWNEARTPFGVSVSLASPGTDELGRTGLPGAVDRHFWERFGAALLISVVDGAIQAAVASQHGSSNAPIYAPNTSRDVLTEILRSTVAIPPTVVKNHGERIQILVARDVDFRPVYSLRTPP